MPTFSSEPAVYLAGAGAILEALFLVLIAFGVPITPDQKLALGGLGTCLITVLTGIFTRSQVTPTAHVVVAVHNNDVVIAPAVIPPAAPPAA